MDTSKCAQEWLSLYVLNAFRHQRNGHRQDAITDAIHKSAQRLSASMEWTPLQCGQVVTPSGVGSEAGNPEFVFGADIEVRIGTQMLELLALLSQVGLVITSAEGAVTVSFGLLPALRITGTSLLLVLIEAAKQLSIQVRETKPELSERLQRCVKHF